jgi:hypothetical protein
VDPDKTSLQNVTEDAVETVQTDGIEPYCSPYILHQLMKLKLNQTRTPLLVGALDADSFVGLNGTNLTLPVDAPPLPTDFVSSIDDDARLSYKTAYFHVHTGATCLVTDQAAELHCPVPTTATCGTAAKGTRTCINAMGCLVLDFVTDQGHLIPLEFPQATEILQFQRRSLSCHAFKDIGYEVQHSFLNSGNLLRLRKVGQTKWHSIPLITHGRSDYVKVKLHLPAVEGITAFTPTDALTEQTVARLDLLTKLQGPTDVYALVMLIHLRYGCARGIILNNNNS